MNNSNPKRMLVILAHPAEAFLTLTEILSRYAGQGVQVVLLHMGRGACCGPDVSAQLADESDRPNFELVARNLGIETYSLGYSTGELASIEPCMLLETITCWIDLVKPQLIITAGPEAASKNPDEAILSKVVIRAYDECCQKGLLLYTRPVDEKDPELLLTVGRGRKDTENYPDWFEPELVERHTSDGKA